MKKLFVVAGLVATMVMSVLYAGTLAAAAAPRVTIKYAHCCPPDHTYGVYAHTFADKVKENSNGEIVVEVLDGGVMGTEQAIAQKVQLGTVQMGGVTSNNVAQLAPALTAPLPVYAREGVDRITVAIACDEAARADVHGHAADPDITLVAGEQQRARTPLHVTLQQFHRVDDRRVQERAVVIE